MAEMTDGSNLKRSTLKKISHANKRVQSKERYSPYFQSQPASKKLKINQSLPTPSQATNEKVEKVGREFYDCYADTLAKDLLGKRLFRVLDNGEVLSGRIVETEGYLGENDKACHSYGGKMTTRTEAMYMVPGTAYVYIIYGMYNCLNISSKDTGGAVLIRALEPIDGIEEMRKLRSARKKKSKSIKSTELCSGPSKLCQAMKITKDDLNKEDMVLSKTLWIENDPEVNTDFEVVTSTRIGVKSYGEQAAQMPLRFYILGNKCVSVRDKNAETLNG